MNYKIFEPSKELDSIVRQYIVFNSLENIESTLFLPDGGNFLVFNRGLGLSAKCIGDDSCFEIPKNYSYSFKTNRVKQIFLDKDYVFDEEQYPIIVVELLPIGFYKLFDIDMSNTGFGYEEIDKNIVNNYFSNLYSNGDLDDELEYLNLSLIALMQSSNTPIPFLEEIVDKIYNDYNLEVLVEDLVEEFSYSRSTLERHFKKMIGLTPKNFIFTSKFSKTLIEYINEKRTLREIQYMYSDNSHMNTVFRKFLGVAPSEIFKMVLNGNVSIYQLLNLDIDKASSIKKLKVTDINEVLKYSKDLNVLYIEDDEQLRTITHNVLNNFFNSVSIAVDGKDGLVKYMDASNSDTEFDIVITDINMPNMNGIDIMKEIYKIQSSAVFIILSAHCEFITTAKELGAKFILTKPVAHDTLIDSIFEVSRAISR